MSHWLSIMISQWWLFILIITAVSVDGNFTNSTVDNRLLKKNKLNTLPLKFDAFDLFSRVYCVSYLLLQCVAYLLFKFQYWDEHIVKPTLVQRPNRVIVTKDAECEGEVDAMAPEGPEYAVPPANLPFLSPPNVSGHIQSKTGAANTQTLTVNTPPTAPSNELAVKTTECPTTDGAKKSGRKSLRKKRSTDTQSKRVQKSLILSRAPSGFHHKELELQEEMFGAGESVHTTDESEHKKKD